MTPPEKNISWPLLLSYFVLLILATTTSVQAALSDYTNEEQMAYEAVAAELTNVNGLPHQAADIERCSRGNLHP